MRSKAILSAAFTGLDANRTYKLRGLTAVTVRSDSGVPGLSSPPVRPAGSEGGPVPLRPDAFRPVSGYDDRAAQAGMLSAFRDRCVLGGHRTFIGRMGTGSGKTASCLSTARHLFDLYRDEVAAGTALTNRRGARLAIAFAPTTCIRDEWIAETARLTSSDPAARIGILDPRGPGWRNIFRNPRSVADGTVLLCSPQSLESPVTCEAVTSLIDAMDGEVAIFVDELHHYSGANKWGAAVGATTARARYLVGLSGTLYRHDDGVILGVTEDDACEPHYVYGKEEGLREGIIAPLIFQLIDAEISQDGADSTVTPLSDCKVSHAAHRVLWRKDGDFAARVIDEAVAALEAVRRRAGPSSSDRIPAGAIQCADVDQMADMRAMLEARGQTVLTTHCRDNGSGTEVIGRFRQGEGDWLLAIRRLTEGLNVKRLRVGVYASNVLTLQTFSQYCGRFERLLPGLPAHEQIAHVILPRLPDFETYAAQYETEESVADRRRRLPPRACPSCGEVDPESAGTCPDCGRKIEPDSVADPMDTAGAVDGDPNRDAFARALGSTFVRGRHVMTREQISGMDRMLRDPVPAAFGALMRSYGLSRR